MRLRQVKHFNAVSPYRYTQEKETKVNIGRKIKNSAGKN